MPYHWSTHQLTEYLVSVSGPQDPRAAMAVALERAVEALDAEVGAIVVDGAALVDVGFGTRGVPAAFLAAATGTDESVRIEGAGLLHLARGSLGKAGKGRVTRPEVLVAGRLGEPCTAEEFQMLQGMALVLGLAVHNLESLQAERSRHRLVETLLAIQRAISARRPLKELLDAVTEGASSLLGGCPVALLLADPVTPGELLPASSFDFPDLDAATLDVAAAVMSGPRPPGAARPQAHGCVIAEPVEVDGQTAGCLVARIDAQGQQLTDHPELLEAFAQQVSLALTDARTLDAVREAYHDSITGLPNRALFLERAERGRQEALRHGDDLCVMFIDLDRFKAVNDTLGHKAGDDLLAEVARRIGSCVRPNDLAARLGGDEFAVLLDRTGLDVGQRVARRVIDALTTAFVVGGREVSIGASVGIASLTAHQGAADLLSDADVAMYRAKRSGGGRSVVFERYMHDDVAHHLTLRTDLQHAQAAGQLWLAYQPILRIAGGEVTGVEALMRWTHPERGSIPPQEFIPVAEESHTIISIGAWAIRQGLTEFSSWPARPTGLGLSLNVSARQIVDPQLPTVIASALRLSGFPPEGLTLEITESVLMDDPDLARTRLEALKELGVRLAIDDFGTGYSSLAYLRRFPVDQLKIDRSFITPLTPDAPDDIAVVRSVVSLCRSLRLETLAEGIERPEQLAILRELGCDLGQGYLFAEPLAAPQCEEFTRAPGPAGHPPQQCPPGPAARPRPSPGRPARH
jgi:diguanylate cyclase (GGDEF)-like protein